MELFLIFCTRLINTIYHNASCRFLSNVASHLLYVAMFFSRSTHVTSMKMSLICSIRPSSCVLADACRLQRRKNLQKCKLSSSRPEMQRWAEVKNQDWTLKLVQTQAHVSKCVLYKNSNYVLFLFLLGALRRVLNTL